jgi:hypothetical protein
LSLLLDYNVIKLRRCIVLVDALHRLTIQRHSFANDFASNVPLNSTQLLSADNLFLKRIEHFKGNSTSMICSPIFFGPSKKFCNSLNCVQSMSSLADMPIASTNIGVHLWQLNLASAKKSPSRINGRGASRFRPSAYCDVLKANASRF